MMQLMDKTEKLSKLNCNGLAGYLINTIRNIALKELERERRVDGRPPEEHWEMADPEPSPQQQLEKRAEQEVLMQALLALPPQARNLLQYKYVLEWDNRRIARELSLSENSVRVYLMRARKMLKEQYISFEGE
jgi:RNA polymerase sigma-70 factor (ECF subfamily)